MIILLILIILGVMVMAMLSSGAYYVKSDYDSYHTNHIEKIFGGD